MKDNHVFRGNRVEESLRGYPGIYKVWMWNKDKGKYVEARLIPGCRQKPYRAKRRVKILGKTRQESLYFDSVEEARDWRYSKEVGPKKIRPSSYVMIDLVSDWRVWLKPPRVTESTWEMYGKDIEHLKPLSQIPVDELSVQDIDRWLQTLVDPSYPKKEIRVSFEREVGTLGQILNWYREYKNPSFLSPVLKRHKKDSIFRKKPMPVERAMRWEELETFLVQLREGSQAVYYYLAAFQALTGARIGEACGLFWDSVDLENRRVTFRRTIWWNHKSRKPNLKDGTKTGEVRVVILSPRLVQLLKEWRKTTTCESFVFHRHGSPLGYRSIQSAYNKAFKALGLPYRSTHVLRHTFATLYAAQTGNRTATQAVLGHRSSKMTDRYARPQEQSQWDSINDFLVGQLQPEGERTNILQGVSPLIQ